MKNKAYTSKNKKTVSKEKKSTTPAWIEKIYEKAEQERKDKKKLDILNSADETKRIKVKILKDKCNFLYKTGFPFVLRKTGNSYELESTMYNEKAYKGGFTIEDLNFIKSVKNHVNKTGVAIDFIDNDFKAEQIDYIKVMDYQVGERIENLYYVDITACYWTTALILGIIDEKLYNKGLKLGKIVRLAALGSLAKVKDVWTFDGKEFKRDEPIHSTETENLWFAICKHVSDIMREIAKTLGNKFVFYWVDGIYVKNEGNALQDVINIFIKHGYTSTFSAIPFVQFTETGFTVQGIKKDDVKEFNYLVNSNKRKKKPVSEYIENLRLVEVASKVIYNKNKEIPNKNWLIGREI